ncbi:MAG: aminomethyl-transferring glycine dehydrogenase subunit GcvPA [Candidatus Saliniplasma sp.]
MDEENEMLESLGLEEVEELFRDVPSEVRDDIDIDEGKTEMETKKYVKKILSKNQTLDDFSNFLGGGIYRHYVPSAVNEIVGRSEFYTSYTPYQAEISQGMLQALFEYQSLVCELTGMDAANTSMYDYPTAFAEGVLMAGRVGRGSEFLVPENIHWEKWEVLHNYLRGSDIEIKKVDYDENTGKIDIDDLQEKLTDDNLGFYVESPNVFGVIEDDTSVFEDLKTDNKSIMVAGTSPLALTLLEPPSEWGADIVVGDSQSLGIPPSFGGPTVGIFACKKRHLRRMPGRMIGETEDAEGNTAYCMTLQTREQHIRRERATSNICTNQSLMALASACYMFVKGGKGLEEVGKTNYEKAHKLAEKIDEIDGFSAPYFDSLYFNEFTVETPIDSKEVISKGMKNKVLAGITIDDKYEKLNPSVLLSATEMNDEDDIDSLIETFREVVE